MKVRTGFVSNSSSSSYVIDTRDPELADFFRLLKKYVKGIETSTFEDFTEEEKKDYQESYPEIPVESIAYVSIDYNGGLVYLDLPKNLLLMEAP